MGLQFTKAQEVKSGQRITSTQFRALAAAFNDRLRGSGSAAPGDCAWRLAYYWFNLWRQVRNPDDSGFVFPSQGEAFDIYHAIEPEFSQDTTWPVAGPGEPEGANLANPMMQFVFGNPVLDSEDIRLNNTIDLWPTFSSPPVTLEDFWKVGKQQRGAYDPINQVMGAPAFDAAQSIFSFAFPYWSPHGKAYGGWQPQPIELLPDCSLGGTAIDQGYLIPSWQIFFTALRKDVPTTGLHGTIGVNADGLPTVTYSGTCPCGSAGFAVNHVMFLINQPFAFLVYVATGTACDYFLDHLPQADWIQGPYSGGASLVHTEGLQLNRAAHAAFTDYRGTPAQRTPDTFVIEDIGFDYQAFFTRQYYLAPNFGLVSGDSIEVRYPTATFTGGTLNGGTLGTFADGTKQHVYHDSFVFAGAFAKATNLFNAVSVELLSGDKILSTLTLTPDKDHKAEALVWIEKAEAPDPLTIRLASQAQFIGSGSITVEATELMEYEPEFQDAYLVSRIESSKGGDQNTPGADGRGKDTDFSKTMSDDYLSKGCIVNTKAAGVRDIAEWVNDDPVYDAARRMTKSHLRIIRRQNLTAYEVANGKSILYFKRYAYGLKNTRVDLFDGIAPPIDPVLTGSLIEGETYIVRGGANANVNRIVYLGHSKKNNDQFTATKEKKFETHGDAKVYVYDGIKHPNALKKGLTNEWVSFLQTKCYHPSPTSIWKAEAYADYFTWCNRCHFYSASGVPALRRFINYNHSTSLDPVTFAPILNPLTVQLQFLSPEAPTGYNYTLGANVTYGDLPFKKSCMIYEAPPEIESCIVDDWVQDIVKVTFKTRFRAHPNAPATVAKTAGTGTGWSAAQILNLRNGIGAIAPEDYRTPDNAIREYVLSEANGNYPCVFRTGDAGAASGVSGLPDNPFGSCYPHFIFVKLIPTPYEDENSTVQDWDTRCTVDAFQQMEVYLRAMCEGFVDGQTSLDIICKYYAAVNPITTLFDYNFENLCFEAFQGKSIGAFSLKKRPDLPTGYGPIPDTIMYADVFNRLASAVNLLTKVRIDVPLEFQSREYHYFSTNTPDLLTCTFGSTDGNSAGFTTCSIPAPCSPSGTFFAYADGRGAGPLTLYCITNWVPATVIVARIDASTATGCPSQIVSSKLDIDYRMVIDPNWVEAVPQEIKDLMDLSLSGFFCVISTHQVNTRREVVTTGFGDTCGGVVDAWFDSNDNSKKFRWVTGTTIDKSYCAMVNSGRLTAPDLLSSDFFIGRTTSMPVGSFCAAGSSASSIEIDLIDQKMAFITVPLVDLP